MEAIPTPPPVQNNPVSTSPGLFGTRIPSTIAFIVGILLFLLPFSEIKCNNSVLANKTGLGFALGSNWKTVSTGLGNDSNEVTKKTSKEKEGYAQYLAIAALAFGVIGLLLSSSNAKGGGSGGVVTGVLSAGALIGVMIEVKRWFSAGLAKENTTKAADGTTDNLGLDQLGNAMSGFSVSFTPWFYIAVIAFLLAAIFSYLGKKSTRKL